MSDAIDEFPQINGMDAQAFAAFTLKNRLPAILDQIIEDNNYNEAIIARLGELKNQILYGKITHFIASGNDQVHWKNWLSPWIGKTWFEVPFYFAEAYFYRLILDHINFFKTQIDPFSTQKKKDIQNSQDRFHAILLDLEHFLRGKPEEDQLIKYLLFLSLWGNKSDLSQLKIIRSENHEVDNKYTLLDDSDEIVKIFSKLSMQVDIILDNSGVELFTDLVLAAHLIKLQLSETIILHTKAYPTFVSDATINDVFYLIKALKNHEKEQLSDLAKRLEVYIREQRILIKDHQFWNAPIHFHEMPKEFSQELCKSDLLILKGDANYRRIFDDRAIPPITKIGVLGNYLPAPAVAIRILKSQLILGMQSEYIKTLNKIDPDWMINGKYGLIQMVKQLT